MDVRLLPNVKCSCGGQIGYTKDIDKDTEEFKCIVCGRSYSTKEEHKTPEAQIKYAHSEKGQEKQEEWRDTERGQQSIQDYDRSPKGKLAKRKYYYGPKGQAAHQRRKTKVTGFKEIEKWLKDNPGKTTEDFFKENQDVSTDKEG